MKKMGGNICDSCRSLFLHGDRVYEFCKNCATTVYCIFNNYEDGTKELFAIFRNKEQAELEINQRKSKLGILNNLVENKIINQEVVAYHIF